MKVAAELSLTSDTLTFTTTLSDGPVTRIRFVPTLSTTRAIFPFFLLWGTDVERAVEMLREDPAVASLTLLNVSADTGLVRVEWTSEGLEWLRDGITKAEVVLLGATVTQSEWTIRSWAGSEADLSVFEQHCREAGLDTTFTKVTTPAAATDTETESVTPDQQEALLRAVERGYFATPRSVTLDELGDELGISRQAFAGRLRRGIRNLVYETLESPESGR